MAASCVYACRFKQHSYCQAHTSFSNAIFFAVLLPPADYLFRKSKAAVVPLPTSLRQVKPAYTFKSGKADPAAFHAWWAYYVNEWSKFGGAKEVTEMPDPNGLLPFVLIPNSTGRFFDPVIRINNIRFRGIDIERDKHDRFRIFNLRESPTFGLTLHVDDRTWPEVLQRLIDTGLKCDRPIEVINAGTEGYTLTNNIERLRRDITPLKPVPKIRL